MSEHRQDRLADQSLVVMSNPVRQVKSENKGTHTISEIKIHNKIYYTLEAKEQYEDR